MAVGTADWSKEELSRLGEAMPSNDAGLKFLNSTVDRSLHLLERLICSATSPD